MTGHARFWLGVALIIGISGLTAGGIIAALNDAQSQPDPSIIAAVVGLLSAIVAGLVTAERRPNEQEGNDGAMATYLAQRAPAREGAEPPADVIPDPGVTEGIDGAEGVPPEDVAVPPEVEEAGR